MAERERALQGVVHSLAALVKNAFDASTSERATVEVEIDTRDPELVHTIVRDRGTGMGAETRARAGEPFFTTKQPGSGMGLGLFLARSFVESIGGRLELRALAPHGTEAVLSIPCAPPRERTADAALPD